MIQRKIDNKNRIVLTSDCMRILQCKPGDTVDIKMFYDSDDCHVLLIRKVENDNENK